MCQLCTSLVRKEENVQLSFLWRSDEYVQWKMKSAILPDKAKCFVCECRFHPSFLPPAQTKCQPHHTCLWLCVQFDTFQVSRRAMPGGNVCYEEWDESSWFKAFKAFALTGLFLHKPYFVRMEQTLSHVNSTYVYLSIAPVVEIMVTEMYLCNGDIQNRDHHHESVSEANRCVISPMGLPGFGSCKM